MKRKSRGFVKSMTRMAVTLGGSYLGSKLAGWVFDNLVDRRA